MSDMQNMFAAPRARDTEHSAAPFTALDQEPLKLSFSVDTIAAYRETLSNKERPLSEEEQKRLEEYESKLSQVVNYGQLLTELIKTPSLDLDMALANETEESADARASLVLSFAEQSRRLLQAYARLYHRIISGYKLGNRQRYGFDKNDRFTLKLLTKDEELSALKQAYHSYAESLEAQYRTDCALHSTLKKFISAHQDSGESPLTAKYQEILQSAGHELLPDNLSAQLIEAALKFESVYAHATESMRLRCDKLVESLHFLSPKAPEE
ncbi:MAG: hypothetical protein IJ228_12715 [Succinivibrio sp.]|nr:hypothetical protein [Succinivibrio sp.]